MVRDLKHERRQEDTNSDGEYKKKEIDIEWGKKRKRSKFTKEREYT